MKWRLLCGIALGLTAYLAIFQVQVSWGSESFQQQYPNIQKYLYHPPDSGVLFGFGVSPIAMMSQKPDLSLSIFQLHWLTPLIDYQIFNGSIGFTYLSTNSSYSINHFTFTTSIQLRLSKNISFGPLIGLEFINFPAVTAVTLKSGFKTPNQPLSTQGAIFGAVMSETFELSQVTQLRISQITYKQNYSTQYDSSGWQYLYDNNTLNLDPSAIASGMVYQLEFSFLY